MLVHRQLLTDENVFGIDVEEFNFRRFLDNSTLAKSKSYTPFGGGPMLCPGRFMVRGEVLIFVALLLERFEAEPLDSKPFPKLDTKTGAGFGILGPRDGEDIVLKLRESKL